MEAEPFQVTGHASDAGARIALAGAVQLAHGDQVATALRRELSVGAGPAQIDLSGVTDLDGGGAAILLALRAEQLQGGRDTQFVGLSAEFTPLIELYRCPTEYCSLQEPPERVGLFDHAGQSVLQIARAARDIAGFIGDMTASVSAAVRRPSTVPWSDLARLSERAGANGAPICLLINLLVGLIIALQSAAQLQRFGASSLVADLVGLSVTRELAPLMTAVVIAGRSGAAFAAELGTMRVSEEVDALRAMGIDPLRQLVFPRIAALALVAPALTLLSMVMGCVGGLLIATYSLDLSVETYANGLRAAIGLGDVGAGLIKGSVFAAATALIACQKGLATSGGAAGVGTSTTSAVVTTLLAVVLLDAGLTAFFSAVGL